MSAGKPKSRVPGIVMILVGFVLIAAGIALANSGYQWGLDKDEAATVGKIRIACWIGAAVGGLVAAIGAISWLIAADDLEMRAKVPQAMLDPRSRGARVTLRIVRALTPWLFVAGLGAIGALFIYRYFQSERGAEVIVWHTPNAKYLLAGAAVVGLLAFHLHRRRAAALGFSQTGLVRRLGLVAWLSDLPSVLRVLGLAALAVALCRPETYRTLKHEVDTIDIMIVVDMSKSMEETDLPRDRLDAAQRVIRRFLRRTTHDRIGLVVFGQQAMLQCPLTLDTKVVEQIVSDLAIGDVPELGTAIGDGLALALSQLRDGRRDTSDPENAPAKSKVVILLSDGDSNWVTRFEPDESARAARDMGVKVYTILVGREESDLFGGMSVNPATLRSIAGLTGGEFFRATDYESFDKGFQRVRDSLDKTKRVETEKIPDKQLFVPLALLALALFGLEILLSHTRFRRLP